MVRTFSLPIGKVKTPAKHAADDDVPDFEDPSEINSKKKVRMPEAAPFEIGLQIFSGDCTLFGFSCPREPVLQRYTTTPRIRAWSLS